MVTMNLEYLDHLRVKAAHGPSKTQLITDAPSDNHGKGESFSPSDLVATALGACIITMMGIKAQQHQVKLTGLTAQIEKIMSSDSPRRIKKIICQFSCKAKVDKKMQTILQRTAMTCPVKESLNPEIELDIQFKWNQ